MKTSSLPPINLQHLDFPPAVVSYSSGLMLEMDDGFVFEIDPDEVEEMLHTMTALLTEAPDERLDQAFHFPGESADLGLIAPFTDKMLYRFIVSPREPGYDRYVFDLDDEGLTQLRHGLVVGLLDVGATALAKLHRCFCVDIDDTVERLRA